MVRDYGVYALEDPRDGRIHYVGRTNRPKARLAEHLAPGRGFSGRARIAWLDELAASGLVPELRVLEGGLTFAESCRAERRWFNRGRREGWPLTNQARPGAGGVPATIYRARLERRFARLSEQEKLDACRGTVLAGSVAAQWLAKAALKTKR